MSHRPAIPVAPVLPLGSLCRGMDKVVGRVFEGPADPLRKKEIRDWKDPVLEDVRDTTFQRCTFRRCVLDGTDFIGCRFIECTFERVSMDCTVFNTVVESCRFFQTRAMGLGFVSLKGGTSAARVVGCTFDQSRFIACRAESAEIARCRLAGELRRCEIQQCRVVDTVFEGLLDETSFWGESWGERGGAGVTPVLENVRMSSAELRFLELCDLDGSGVAWPKGNDYLVVRDLDRAKTDLAGYLAARAGQHERTLRMLNGSPQRRRGTRNCVVCLRDYDEDAQIIREFLLNGGYTIQA